MRFKKLMFMLVLLTIAGRAAAAADGFRVSGNSISIGAGGNTTLDVYFDGAENYQSFQFNLVLPNGVKVKTNEYDDLIYKFNGDYIVSRDNYSSHLYSMSKRKDAENTYTFICRISDNVKDADRAFKNNANPIITITIEAEEGFNGVNNAKIDGIVLTNLNTESVYPADVDFTISVSNETTEIAEYLETQPTITIPSNFIYNGIDIEGKSVEIAGLSYGTDFVVFFNLSGTSDKLENVRDAGEYEVLAYGKGKYVGSAKIGNLVIQQAEVRVSGISVVNNGKVYDGTKDAELDFANVLLEGKVATDDLSATAKGEYDSPDAGNRTVTITDLALTGEKAGNYVLAETGQQTEIFAVINPKSVINPTIILAEEKFAYTGEEIKPTVTVKDGENVIPEDQYQVNYLNNIDVGTEATVLISDVANNNYTFPGSPSVTFEITKIPATITIAPGMTENPVYSGSPIHLVSFSGVADGGQMMFSFKEDDEYTTDLLQATDAGKYTIYYKVKGDANHTDSEVYSAEVTIERKGVIVQVFVNGSYTYTGEKQDVEVVVMQDVGDNVLGDVIPSTEYVVTFKKNGIVTDPIDAGHYEIFVDDNEKGNYKVGAGYKVFDISPKSVAAENLIIQLVKDSYEYTGEPIQAGVSSVKIKDTETIIPAKEYKVSWENNKEYGTATVNVTNVEDGNYSFTASTTFKITKKKASIKTVPVAKTLTYIKDTPQELVVEGVPEDGNGTMQYSEDGENYSSVIPAKTNAGTYKVYYMVAADPAGSYSDNKDFDPITVTISPKEVTTPIIEVLGGPFTYTGEAIEPGVTVKDEVDVIDAVEYTVSHSENVNAGKGIIKIADVEGGNYTVSGEITFKIEKAAGQLEFKEATKTVTFGDPTFEIGFAVITKNGEVTYTSDNEAVVTVDADGKITIKGASETPATITATLKESDNFTSAASTCAITVNPKAIASVDAKFDPAEIEYDGTEKAPTLTVKDGETVLVAGTDYDVTDGVKGTDYGTYTATITLKGNYSGTGTASFKITRRLIHRSTVTLEYSDEQQATGSAIEPAVTVKDGETTLTLGTDYTIAYSDNTAVGTAKITITGIGNYESTREATFVIYRSFAAETEWSTYYSAEDLTLENTSLKAYTITAVDLEAGTVTVSEPLNYLKANTPLLVQNTGSEKNFKLYKAEEAADITSNVAQFVGISAESSEISGHSGMYVLVNGVFVEATSGKIPAQRCYLMLPASARRLTIVGGDGNTTGIENIVETEDGNDTWYDLKGNRIQKPSRKGLYIKNGKKVVIK